MAPLLLSLQAPSATCPSGAGAGLSPGEGFEHPQPPGCRISHTNSPVSQPRQQSFLGWNSIHRAFPGCRENRAGPAKLFQHRD